MGRDFIAILLHHFLCEKFRIAIQNTGVKCSYLYYSLIFNMIVQKIFKDKVLCFPEWCHNHFLISIVYSCIIMFPFEKNQAVLIFKKHQDVFNLKNVGHFYVSSSGKNLRTYSICKKNEVIFHLKNIEVVFHYHLNIFI